MPSPKGSDQLELELDRISDELLVRAPPKLRDSVRYSLLGGGKRIRPRLVLATASALHLPQSLAFRMACAVEMVHAYTLIHDDLPAMDDDDLRRGEPTNHKVYGEAMAILAGDSLALLAFDALMPLQTELPADRLLRLIQTLLEAAGARGVIAGQALEFSSTSPETGGRNPDLESLCEAFRLKTGALFRASLLLPWIASDRHGEKDLGESLGFLGDALGIAFQIADDLEDSFEERRSDPNHIARFLDRKGASALALERIDASLGRLNTLDPKVAQTLEPFLAELRRKAETA